MSLEHVDVAGGHTTHAIPLIERPGRHGRVFFFFDSSSGRAQALRYQLIDHLNTDWLRPFRCYLSQYSRKSSSNCSASAVGI